MRDFTVNVNNASALVQASIDRLQPGDCDYKAGTSNIVIEQILPEVYETESVKQQIVEQLLAP